MLDLYTHEIPRPDDRAMRNSSGTAFFTTRTS